MKKSIAVALLGMSVMVSGCAVGPYTPMNSWNTLDGEQVIYMEQSDRLPRDVLIEAWKHQPIAPLAASNGTNGMKMGVAIDPVIIAEIVKEVLAVIPQVTKGYQAERMNEALFSRRMFFRGYSGAELTNINDIVKSMGLAIETVTPQNKK